MTSLVSYKTGWPRPIGRLLTALSATVVAMALMAVFAGAASAGQAASGELFFYPCSGCHPVAEGGGGAALPNGFEGHEIVLKGHDKLGKGDSACMACHDDPAKDPSKLKLADGSLIDIKGDVAQVCFRCHSAKYKDWQAGIHGKNKPKCTAAGCHDPHTPGYMFADSLRPFTGAGFQFQVLSQREPFHPLAGPAPDPAVKTPTWFVLAGLCGVVVAGGLLGSLFVGRSKR